MSERFRRLAYMYRWDLLSLTVIFGAVIAFLWPIWGRGNVVFSDLDFGLDSKRYLGEIFGVWNERWSTPTMLNIARLPWILLPWLVSGLFGWSGAVFLKTFITLLLLVSAGSMYWLCKRITSVYFSRHFDFVTTIGLVSGALFYALNPWVVFRIQHIFLLCGYSLMPLCLTFFFNAFDPRFQRQFIGGYKPEEGKVYRRNILDLFWFAISFSISAGAIHYFFYGMIFYCGIGGLLLLNTLLKVRPSLRNYWGVLKGFFKKFFLTGVYFGCFSFFWLGTYAGSIVKHAEVSQHNVNVVDTLSLFSRNSTPRNVLYLISYWWPMFDLHALPWTFWAGGGVLMGVIVLTVLTRSWRHPILGLFSLLSVGFFLMGTGVQIEAFANTFVKVVTKTPVIGPIFRDPNKAVGLMAIGFSILLTFGTELLIRWLAPPKGAHWKQALAIAAIAAGLWCYVMPVRKPFVTGFYEPVTLPAEYGRIQGEMLDSDRFDSRVMYLPVADAMTQPETGIATPYWNLNPNPGGMVKATGDFQVYSSHKNTVFQHEGNSPNVDYYLSFLQDLLDRGATKQFGRLLTPFGVNELAYHNEYLGQEKRQRFNLQILKMQEGMEQRARDGLWTLFGIDKPLPYMNAVPRRVFTPYGLTSLESYGALPNFNFREDGVIFSGWEKGGGLTLAQRGDILDTRSLDDMALTTLDRDDYLVPFDAVEDGDPFLKWSKTLLDNPDWQWGLRSQGLRGFTYETDLNASVVLTFASRRLNLRPYQMAKAQASAPVVINFDDALRQDKMFKADAPEKVAVQSYPGGPYANLPMVHGEVSRGEPGVVWQVAKSGYFPAAANTPYQFRVLASGRGTNKLHIKARFFDARHEEIGVQYVVAPSQRVDFDAVNLFGECISPPGARWLRLDLLTLPRKETRVYWWIHDLEIRSLAKWAVPNVIQQVKKVRQAGPIHAFVRLLLSARGGTLRFRIGQRVTDIDTRDATLTQFAWKDLGTFQAEKGDLPVSIENISGFNAVNIIALVPIEHLATAEARVVEIAAKCRLVVPLQAETDFRRSGPIQSDRVYPDLAMGQGFTCNRGSLTRKVDILRGGEYTVAVWTTAGNGNGEIAVQLKNEADGQVWERTIHPKRSEDELKWVVEPVPTDEHFPRELKHLPGLLNGYGRLDVPFGRLPAGHYTLSLKMESRVHSMAQVRSFRLFDPREITIGKGAPPEPDTSCATCVNISNDMMKPEWEGNLFRLHCAKTCSCQWYIYSSDMLPGEGDAEYLISFDARSENVRRRHTKVFCLDANHRPLSTIYINEVEASEQSKWHHYQQILLTPPGTKYLQFHIWARGGETRDGVVEMKGFGLVPMRKLLTVDQVALVQGTDVGNVFASPPAAPDVEFRRMGSMKRLFKVGGQPGQAKLIRFGESPSPLWEMHLGNESSRAAVALNGVSNGFATTATGEGVVEAVLRKFYFLGLAAFAAGFPLVWLSWRRAVPQTPPDD